MNLASRKRLLYVKQKSPQFTPAPKLKSTIVSVGTATPPKSYTQAELLNLFKVEDRRVHSLFLNGAIDRRCLALPPLNESGLFQSETQGELLDRHRMCAVEIGARAIQECLRGLNGNISEISHLCCVTTTGFLTPSLSALLSCELGISNSCARLDVVGMGCNAGLNALNTTSCWTLANPGKLAIMLCVEICSAAYVFDSSVRSAVVNSLFGDGAAALALRATDNNNVSAGPAIQRFQSRIITDAIRAMRFDWDESHGKFSFFLDPNVPYVIGANVEGTIDQLLLGTGVRRSEIAHWVIHSGGKKVIDALRVNLGLSVHDLRHTSAVLREYGNLSSASFLFSYERLLSEKIIHPGEYGVMITMGPGSTIESALLQW